MFAECHFVCRERNEGRFLSAQGIFHTRARRPTYCSGFSRGREKNLGTPGRDSSPVAGKFQNLGFEDQGDIFGEIRTLNLQFALNFFIASNIIFSLLLRKIAREVRKLKFVYIARLFFLF